MKKIILLIVLVITNSTVIFSQTPLQFSGSDCNGNPVNLFDDLDAGKAVILHFYMPSCGSCPPPAKKIQAMAAGINAMHPGMVKGYAFPFQNSTTCSYSSGWVSSNGLDDLYAPMDSGATHVANYGGFGMPTVVLLGGSGTNRRVMFSSQSFSTNDTTEMRDSILALLNATGLNDFESNLTGFTLYPNPSSDILEINIDVKKKSTLEIELIDILGHSISIISNEEIIGNRMVSYNVSKLQSGTYIAHLRINDFDSYKKLIINH
ncbi:MAG: hypothetical protein RIQ89_2293 [Bacteroidota bacterium]|jgi:hypothetical protein